MDKKIVYYKEPSLERVNRDINRLYDALKREKMDELSCDYIHHIVKTKHVIVRFVTELTNTDGIRCDEHFGFGPYDHMELRLKDTSKPRYNGTVIGYIVKTEAEETLKDEIRAEKAQIKFQRACDQYDEWIKRNIHLDTSIEGLNIGLYRPNPDYSKDAMLMKKAVAALGEFKYTPIIPNIKSYIKKVVFNDPATIIFWTDDTKTVVKAENEPFDPEKGMAMAIAKKVLGNKHDYYNTFVKWMKKYKPEESSNEPRTDAKRKALEEAYQILLKADDTRYDGKEGKATKIDYYMTVETALGYLGEALEG